MKSVFSDTGKRCSFNSALFHRDAVAEAPSNDKVVRSSRNGRCVRPRA